MAAAIHVPVDWIGLGAGVHWMLAPAGRGASENSVHTTAVAISMVIAGILMVFFREVASTNHYLCGAADSARLTSDGG